MESFLNKEIRCDFLVDVRRKKIWKEQLLLYKELKRVCDKYNIKCFAFGGTLLGAIRHNGFIPWDDDFDVAMSRKDFSVLCNVGKSEFKNPYFLQYALSDRNYFNGIARLRNSNTTGIVTALCNHIYNNGIYIDIYVYDRIPEDNRKLKRLVRKVKIYENLLNNYYHYNNKNKKLSIARPLFFLVSKVISFESLYNKYIETCTSCTDSDSERMGFLCMPYFLKYEATEYGITHLLEHKFEFLEIDIPSDYDYMLKKAYGNYMEFPPLDQRGTWHDNQIIYDPDIPFLEYYKNNPEKFKKVLKEYKEIEDESINT